MNKDKIIYTFVGLIIGVVGVWTINSLNSRPKDLNTQNAFSNSSSSKTIDSHFIEQMIPHHQDAISMAKVAQAKAQHSEIKQLANNIIDSQSKEINQMQDWYKKWFGKDLPSGSQVMNQHGMMETNSQTHMSMMGDDTDLKTLDNSSQFDKAFIEQMIPHHQMAVMMANMLLDGSDRPEMKELANNIVSAQTKEINEMRQWYKNWGYANGN